MKYRILAVFLFLGTHAFADDKDHLSQLGVADFEGPNKLACSFYVAQSMGHFVRTGTKLLSSQARIDIQDEINRRRMNQERATRFTNAVFTMADFINTLGKGHQGDFAYWSDEAFGLMLYQLQVDPDESQALLEARRFLAGLGPTAIQWGKGGVARGSDANVIELLEKVGVPVTDRLKITTALTAVRSSSATDALHDTLAALRDHHAKLIVCVTDSECKFGSGDKQGSAIFTTSTENMKHVRAVSPGHPMSAVTAGRSHLLLPEHGLRRTLDLMVVPYPDLRDYPSLVYWLEEYYHEATHFADTILLSKWVQANRILFNRREALDPYFSFVRIERHPSGQEIVAIQEDFNMILFESRAYHAMSQVHWLLFPKDAEENKKYDAYLKANGVAQVNRHAQWSSLLKDVWRVTREKPDDFFDIGEQIVAQMRDTIKRAGLED